MLLLIGIFTDLFAPIAIGFLLFFSVWTFVGYKRRWKHIFCSYQNAYHRKMTPGRIDWDQIKKSDAYGVPLIFFLFALAGIAVLFLL